jgi:effector-binding domain-containing protein
LQAGLNCADFILGSTCEGGLVLLSTLSRACSLPCRILALKDLGFPLHCIAEALEEGVSADTIRGMLMLRRIEQEDRVQEEVERLARLKARLRLIERDGTMTNDVVLKELAPQWIASVRETIPSYRSIGILFGTLYGTLGSLAAEGLGVALFHDQDFKEESIDVEVGVCQKQAIPVSDPLATHQLPAATVASVVHNGAFNCIAEAYETLLKWVEDNGYRKTGPARELFLQISAPVSRDDESYVTEIQVPVKKN